MSTAACSAPVITNWPARSESPSHARVGTSQGRCLQRAAERGRAAAGGDHFVVPAAHYAGHTQVDAVDWDDS
jgi:hypothetical protein